MPSDGKSSHGLWSGELKRYMQKIGCWFLKFPHFYEMLRVATQYFRQEFFTGIQWEKL
jgi:hypothetical protein